MRTIFHRSVIICLKTTQLCSHFFKEIQQLFRRSSTTTWLVYSIEICRTNPNKPSAAGFNFDHEFFRKPAKSYRFARNNIIEGSEFYQHFDSCSNLLILACDWLLDCHNFHTATINKHMLLWCSFHRRFSGKANIIFSRIEIKANSNSCL